MSLSNLPETQTPAGKTKKESSNLSDDQKELLIGAVRRAPCLWKIKHPQYRDRELKDNSWHAVSTELQGEDATKWTYSSRVEWEKLRDTFNCVKRRRKKKSGQAAENEPVWKFFTLMSFLNDKDSEVDDIFDSFDYVDEDSLMTGAEAGDENEILTIEDEADSVLAQRQNSGDATSQYSGFVEQSSGKVLRPASAPAASTSPAPAGDVPMETSSTTTLLSTPISANVAKKRARILTEQQQSTNQKSKSQLKSEETNAEIKRELLSHVRTLRSSGEEDAFAYSIGQQLKAMKPAEKIRAMKEIQDILYNIRVLSIADADSA